MNTNIVNMFTAKKVRLHGMKSAKWTTRDKILQYKGLINLYTRDRKIIDLDTNVSRRKTERELKELGKRVYTDRRALDNAIRGDKQKLRNTLSEHKELQLAYQNSQPKKVIELIDQRNFNGRKMLDRLLYEKKLKSKKMIDLKLERALLEDRLKYKVLGQLKQEEEAQIITGKVQEAILRKDAAWAIQQIYREILNIMNKDALYFDSIMETVKNDGYNQSICFLGATKLGQLATEYLDDRRQEFNTLEKIIVKDLATRKIDIKILNEQVENALQSIKQLIRKDSDTTTCMIKIPETHSVETLHKDVKQVEKTLRFLQETTSVPSFDQIFPCLQQQLKQNRRLRKLVRKFEESRDTILNKTNHAELMNKILKTTAHEDIAGYKMRKEELLTGIETTNTEIIHCKNLIEIKRNVLAQLRINLSQLLIASYNIKTPEETKKATPLSVFPVARASHEKAKILLPESDETDGIKITTELINKFTILMNAYRPKLKDNEMDEAFRSFEAVMQERMILAVHLQEELSSTSLLQGLYTEAPQELTREDIKKQSQEIVEANTKNDDLIPVFAPPSRMKFKKK